MRPAKPEACFRKISRILCSDCFWHVLFEVVLDGALRRLGQYFCVFTIAFTGFAGLVLPLVVYVPAWGVTQAVVGWCQTETAGAVAPKGPPEEGVLGCWGTDHSLRERDRSGGKQGTVTTDTVVNIRAT